VTAIRVEGLGRRYGKRWAVRGLDFEAAEGEVLGFLGPNGAGKTTTVKILTGQLPPTEGRATVAGADVVRERSALGSRIGVTFEQQNLYERLSVRDNLSFFASLTGAPRGRVDALLSESGLADRAGDPVSKLSKGTRQRVVLARALLGEPRVLFLDEPTAGLDPLAARQVRDWIAHRATQGVTVFLTTHDMEETSTLCHRVAIIDRGSLAAQGTPRELMARVTPPHLRVTLGDGRVVDLPPTADEAAHALGALAAEGRVSSIEEVSVNLEEVFLRLTGHSLTGD